MNPPTNATPPPLIRPPAIQHPASSIEHPPGSQRPQVRTSSSEHEGKPEISQMQANFEVHKAALSAMTQAKQAGFDPDSATALLDNASCGLSIEGVLFPPLGGGLVLALPALGLLINKSTLLKDDSCEMAAMALALHDTQAFWRIVRANDVTKLEEAVFEFMQRFSIGALKQITVWINTEYARLQGDAKAQGVGKLEAAASPPQPSPDPQTPEPRSDSSNNSEAGTAATPDAAGS